VSTSLIDRVSDVYGSFSRSLELDQGLSADVELSLDDASALAKSIETLSLAPVKGSLIMILIRRLYGIRSGGDEQFLRADSTRATRIV